MKILSLIFLSLGFFGGVAVAQSPLAPVTATYHFFAEANSIAELQKLNNCLDYSVCSKNRVQFSSDGQRYRLQVQADLSLEALTAIVRQCPRSYLPQSLTVYRAEPGVYRRMNLSLRDSGAQIDSYYKFRPNILIRNSLNPEFSKAHIAGARTKLVSTTSNEIFSDFVQKMGLFPLDTLFRVDSSKNREFGGLYSPARREVTVAAATFENNGSFVSTVRHELEHAGQHDRIRFCGGQSTFADRMHRERSAYLNDYLNSAHACSQDQTCSAHIQQHALKHSQRYLQPAE